MTEHTEANPAHGADRFTDENGKDWFWTGAYTREQALGEFCNDEDNPPEVTVVRGRIALEPGDVSPYDERLYVDPDGPLEFWQIEGGEY